VNPSTSLALLASGLWGTSDFLGGSLSRSMAARHVLAGSQVVATVLVLAAVLGSGQQLRGGAGWAWALAAGVTWALGMAAFYTALAVGTMGVVAPIAATGAALPVLVGLATGDRPALLALGGAAVALVGVAAAAGPDATGPTGQRRAVLLAVVAAVLFGVEIYCLARGSRSSVPTALVGMRAGALACLGAFLVPRGRRGRHRARAARPDRATGGRLVLLGVLDAGATTAYAVAARTEMVSLLAVLASLYPAVTVVLARQVHGERLSRVQSCGVLAALGGAVCIGLAG
jgi:drug/metabolite transporter (DMT)-like permease